MGSWEVGQPRLQLDFLMLFLHPLLHGVLQSGICLYIPCENPLLRLSMISWCSVTWVFKKLPSSSTNYILIICNTKILWSVIQHSQGCQASNRLQSLMGSDKKRYTHNAKQRYKGMESLDVILHCHIFHLFLLLILPFFLCNLPTTMNEATSPATNPHSASPVQVALLNQAVITSCHSDGHKNQ